MTDEECDTKLRKCAQATYHFYTLLRDLRASLISVNRDLNNSDIRDDMKYILEEADCVIKTTDEVRTLLESMLQATVVSSHTLRQLIDEVNNESSRLSESTGESDEEPPCKKPTQ